MTSEQLIRMVEQAATARSDEPIERRYIALALHKIDRGEATVPTYPTGAPSLKAVYDLARTLRNAEIN